MSNLVIIKLKWHETAQKWNCTEVKLNIKTENRVKNNPGFGCSQKGQTYTSTLLLDGFGLLEFNVSFVTVTDVSRPCQPKKLIPLLPWPGFDPSFSGHNDEQSSASGQDYASDPPGWLLLDGGLVKGYPWRIWVIIGTPHLACCKRWPGGPGGWSVINYPQTNRRRAP